MDGSPLHDREAAAVWADRADVSLPVMKVSLLAMLAVAAASVLLGIRMDRPPSDPLEMLAGPAPSLGWGDRAKGEKRPTGRTIARTCRSADIAYLLYVPRNHDPDRSYPLVVALPGRQPFDSAGYQVSIWAAPADRSRFLVVAPKLKPAAGPHPDPVSGLATDEQRQAAAVLAIVTEMTEDREVDPAAIFLDRLETGHSIAEFLAANEAGQCFRAIFVGEAARQAVGLELALDPEQSGWSPVRIVVKPRTPGAAPASVLVRPVISSRIGKIRRYAWDFGVLAPGVSRHRMHRVRVTQPGSYPVKLTVTDEKGRAYSASVMLSIPAAKDQPLK